MISKLIEMGSFLTTEMYAILTVIGVTVMASVAGVDVARIFLKKLYLLAYGIVNMFTENSRGASAKTREAYTQKYKVRAEEGASKTVYFVRHGQSEWNYIANRGIKGFIMAPFYMLREALLLFSAESLFFDSPLSSLGRQQGQNINSQVQAKGNDMMKNFYEELEDEDTLMVSSNLRRAISTMCYGFAPFLKTKPLLLLSELQEMTRNVDGIALAQDRNSRPPCPATEADNQNLYKVLDLEEYAGGKALWQTKAKGLRRLFGMGEFLLERDEDVIVCGGHSIYFRTFFQLFYPDLNHPCHKNKIANGGVVKFEFVVENGKFVIKDIEEVIVGFDK